MKALGTTLFAIVLTMSPVVIVNAQTTAQPTTEPNVVTESDLQKTAAGLSKKIERSTAELKAELQQTKAQADVQRAADKTAAEKRDADQKAELARQAKVQADATKTTVRIIAIICAVCLFVVVLIISSLIRTKRAATMKQEAAVATATPTKSPTPEDLYGTYPSPAQVKDCLQKNNLREERFTIDLPDDNLVFEYRAVVDLEGTVTARFAGNSDEVTALRHLRKRAKELYANGTGPLKPITLRSTGIRRVS